MGVGSPMMQTALPGGCLGCTSSSSAAGGDVAGAVQALQSLGAMLRVSSY